MEPACSTTVDCFGFELVSECAGGVVTNPAAIAGACFPVDEDTTASDGGDTPVEWTPLPELGTLVVLMAAGSTGVRVASDHAGIRGKEEVAVGDGVLGLVGIWEGAAAEDAIVRRVGKEEKLFWSR